MTKTNSPIDYLEGFQAPLFCICKSDSYASNPLKTNNLEELNSQEIFCKD